MFLSRKPTLGAMSALALLGVAAHPVAASTNLLVNGKFTSPAAPAGSFLAGPVTGWTDLGGQYGVVKNSYLNGNKPASLSGQSLFLNDSEAFQKVGKNKFLSGVTYVLTGSVLQNNKDLAYTTPAPTSEFAIFSQKLNSTLATGFVSATSSSVYTYVTPLSFQYQTSYGNIIVELINPAPGAGTSSPGQVQSDFSNLNLSAAPEPSEIGMLALMGLGLGGLMLRARKAKTLAA